MGPNVTVPGLTALKPVPACVVGVVEGVTLAEAVTVAPGVTVCPAPSMVNVTDALRGLSASVARIVCCPALQPCSTVKVALNVPSPLTMMVVAPDACFGACGACSFWMASAQDDAGPLAAVFVVGRAADVLVRIVLPSSVQVTALPGIKWLPCRWSEPPAETSAPPSIERDGARIVRPMPIILARMTKGMMRTMISHVAQPGAGCGLFGRWGPGLCGRRLL